MTDETTVKQVAYDALEQMYDEAEPGLDFYDVVENPDDYDDDWFQQHTLDSDRQREIVDEHCEKHDLTESEETSVTWTAILDLGPSQPPRDEQ